MEPLLISQNYPKMIKDFIIKTNPTPQRSYHQRLIITYSPKYAFIKNLFETNRLNGHKKMLDSGSTKKEPKKSK